VGVVGEDLINEESVEQVGNGADFGCAVAFELLYLGVLVVVGEERRGVIPLCVPNLGQARLTACLTATPHDDWSDGDHGCKCRRSLAPAAAETGATGSAACLV